MALRRRPNQFTQPPRRMTWCEMFWREVARVARVQLQSDAHVKMQRDAAVCASEVRRCHF